MKKTHFLSACFGLLAGSLLLSSCDDAKEKLKINISVPLEITDATFEIPQSSVAGNFSDSYIVHVNFDSVLAANSASNAEIRSLEMKSFNCEIQNPDTNNNFAVVQNAAGKLARVNGSEEVSVGEVNNNPDVYAATLSLQTAAGDFSSYIKNNDFMVNLSGTTRRGTTKALTVKAKIKFTINAQN